MSRLITGAENAEGRRLTPREAGVLMAQSAPPLTDEQVEAAARLFAVVESEAAS